MGSVCVWGECTCVESVGVCVWGECMFVCGGCRGL